MFGNVAAAVVPDVLDAGGIYISTNTASAPFAGKGCHKNYFVASWQNDGQGESAGALAQDLGYKKAFIMAPNYPSGKEMMAAFRKYFKGDVVEEKYTQLGQTDFAVEIAAIRAANPDVVHVFEPGGMGIAFMRQYHQSGLKIPLVVHAAYARSGDGARARRRRGRRAGDEPLERRFRQSGEQGLRRGLEGEIRQPSGHLLRRAGL